jgi:predicted ATPase/class 3 adenylate cyclase/DNA-binding CsgD family transcriptional regulator
LFRPGTAAANITHMADVVGVSSGHDRHMGMTQFQNQSDESGRGLLRLNQGDGRERSLPTGVVTLLLSDVEGSTRLWEADVETAAAAMARHLELFDAAISRHGGVRPKEQGEGDSVVGAFASAQAAVGAALDVQRDFANEPWPTDRSVRVRIALHSGEARLRVDDEANYCGLTIIRCARLRSVAHGGQTLLSDAVRDLVVDGLPNDVTLRNLGLHRLKDLGRPERVWQLCHSDIDVEFPPLRSLDSYPNNLPAQLTAFVGRDTEMEELREMSERHRLVTLTGVGGCGKTRLALQLAAEVVERHPGGTWWIELAGVSDPELVTATVATALGVRAEPERPLIDTLAQYLQGQDALIVLDNCEQVLASSASVVEELLRSVADLAVVATSREPLGITGELAWRVPSLDNGSGSQLFADRAALVRPGFRPDETESEFISRICQRLDGLPLAIELAAARTRMMSPSSIATALEDRFRLLTGGGRSAQPRQQTLEASVAWSHDLLDETERAVLRRLSVFNGGFTLDAAEQVCGDGIIDSYSVLDLLGRLVDKSLVQTADMAAETRYLLLETIRHFARDRLLESGETDAARNHHLRWFLAYAERAEPELGSADGPRWMDRLDAEHDNLQSALEWAETTGDGETLLRLTIALSLFWELRGHRHQGIGSRWFTRALALDQGPSVARARALWAAAHMGIYGGDAATTVALTPDALAVAEAVDDQQTIARAGNTINYIVSMFDPRQGLKGLAQSIGLARSIGDEWGAADGLKMMTIAWAAQGDYEAALGTAHELAQVAGRLGNKFFLAWSHASVGYVALRRGDLATVRDRLGMSIALCEDVGDPITRWLAICWLGEADALTGNYPSAQARYEQVLHKGVASEGDLARHWAIPGLGSLMLALDDIAGAAAVIDPAVTDFEDELPMISIPFLCAHGELLMATGDATGASVVLDKARDKATHIDNGPLGAQVDHQLGRLARMEGEPVEAEHLHHRALIVCHEHRLVPGIVAALEALAGIAVEQESAAEAARLFGATAAIRSASGLVRRPADQAGFEQDVAGVRQQLDETFAATWAEGESLTLDEAVAYASRTRGERRRPASGWASLTPTEIEVVKLAAKGLSNPEIGDRLFIGRSTVKTHLAHVFTKLGVSSRAELAAEATRRGF